MKRDSKGRFKRESNWSKDLAFGLFAPVLLVVPMVINFELTYPHIEVAEAKEMPVMSETEYQHYVAKDVEIEIEYSRESIVRMIRETFPEDPDYAIKMFTCESNLDPKIQSYHQLSYGRERSFGIAQIHEPDWGERAEELGYTDWKTDPVDNLAMARYIYDQFGWLPWSCRHMI